MGKSIEVILLEDVEGLGRSGDACHVKAGYARNYLFAKKLAITMTPGTARLIAKKREEAAIRLAKEKERLEGEIRRSEGKLNNPGFVNKAPAALVEAEKQKIETNRQMAAALQKQLSDLEA